MKKDTILFLTYYYHQEDREHPVLRHIIDAYCPAYLPFDMYMYQPLENIFSRVILYDYLKRRAEIGLSAMNREILEIVLKEKPGYVLWTSFYDDIQQDTLDQIREQGSNVIGWFFDDDWRFNYYSKFWAHSLDYCVTNSPEAVSGYRQLGANVIQTVPNTGIALARPDSADERIDVSFVGSVSIGDRKECIEALHAINIPVQTFGSESGGYVSYDRMLEIFRTSRINLNFSKGGGYYRLRQIKGRVFQVCMAGGFVLTETTPGLERYFTPGKEIVTFEDTEEAVEKIRYYLDHDEERRTIARAGWERASREYTSDAMIAKVFTEIDKDMQERTARPATLIVRPEMSLLLRRFPSRYHFLWARALIMEHAHGSFWRESLKKSLAYNQFNLIGWYYYFVGILPAGIQSWFSKPCEALEKLPIKVFHWLNRNPLTRGLTDKVFRKLF